MPGSRSSREGSPNKWRKRQPSDLRPRRRPQKSRTPTSGWCGQPYLAISHDEGQTWTKVQVAKNGMPTQNDDATEVLHTLLVTVIDHIPDLVVHADHVLDREIDVEGIGVGARDEEEVELVLEKEKEEREVVVHVEEGMVFDNWTAQ